MVMQFILYGILVVILAVVGYYIATAINQTAYVWLGAGLGAAAGAMISAGIWYASSDYKFSENFVY